MKRWVYRKIYVAPNNSAAFDLRAFSDDSMWLRKLAHEDDLGWTYTGVVDVLAGTVTWQLIMPSQPVTLTDKLIKDKLEAFFLEWVNVELDAYKQRAAEVTENESSWSF